MNSTIPEKIGKYEITSILGQGGMGVVFLGYDRAMDRQVAIKTVKENAPDEIKERFAIEGRAGKLQHDNIVTIYETGHWENERPYIAMQFIDGEPLDKLLSSGKKLSLLEKLEIIRQVCLGLDYAHLNRVVHRDIKPANIIRRRDGRAIIVGFGIARVQSSLTMTGMTGPLSVIGTLGYMAPERLSGARGDGRVDIFATGVMLYFLLTGVEPFAGQEMQSVMHKIVSEPFPPLKLHLDGYPPALDEILERALAKSPDDRYSTAQEFAADLSAIIDELNRGRLAGLLEDANRLIADSQLERAVERARELLRIDPQNQEGRRLLREIQKRIDEQEAEERLSQLLSEAEEALNYKRYDQAIKALETAVRLRPGNLDLQSRLERARQARNTQDRIDALESQAEEARKNQDLTGALAHLRAAYELNPDNPELFQRLAAIEKEKQEQDVRLKAERHIHSARQKIQALQFTDALEILEALRRQVSHPQLDALYQEALQGRKQQEDARLRDQVSTQVRKLLFAEEFAQAIDEVNRGLAALPDDTALLRLKKEAETQSKSVQLKSWISETVDQVQQLSLASPAEALEQLHKAMDRLPGQERFEALERELVRRQREGRKEAARRECLRQAGEALDASQSEQAIRIVDAYLSEYPPDAETDALVQEARRAIAEQQQRLRIADSFAQGRALVEQARFEEAIRLITPIAAETRDHGLTKLLEQAEEGKADVERKLKILSKRLAELRQQGKLDEAIRAIAEQPPALLQNSLLQEVFSKLRVELKRNNALAEAIAKSSQNLEKEDLSAAREPLENVRRVYGEFDALSAARASLDQKSTALADRRLAESLESAHAGILGGDKQAAWNTLQGAKAFVEFASPAPAAEWQRLEKEIRPRSAPRPVGEEAPAPSKPPLLAISAAVLLVIAIGGFFLWRSSHKPPPPLSQILVKTQAGASVAIDADPPRPTDEHGQLTVTVRPGVHKVAISAPGFATFTDENVNVNGGPYAENVPSLMPLVTAHPGTLLLKAAGDLQKVTVVIDNKFKSALKTGETMTLEEGPHTIHYSAPGYEDSAEKPITIVAGQTTTETFKLAKSPASAPVPAPPASGGVAPTPTQPVAPVVTAASIRSFDAEPSGPVHPGDSVTLRWETDKAEAVAIDPGFRSLGASGQQSVTVSSDTTYTLTARGSDQKLVQQSVKVAVVAAPPPPKPVVPDVPAPATTAHNDSADFDLIRQAKERYESAVNSRDVAKVRAAWPGVGSYANQLDEIFKRSKQVHLAENCQGLPGISGTTARWSCSEVFAHDNQPRPFSRTMVFSKQGDRWVLSDITR